MRFALRPYIIAGVAIAGASVTVLAATTPQLPDVQVPAVQPAGSQVDDFNVQTLQGLLDNPDNALLVPEVGPAPGPEVVNPPEGTPGPAQLPEPVIVPPSLGPLDLNGLTGPAPSLGGAPNLLSPPTPAGP